MAVAAVVGLGLNIVHAGGLDFDGRITGAAGFTEAIKVAREKSATTCYQLCDLNGKCYTECSTTGKNADIAMPVVRLQ